MKYYTMQLWRELNSEDVNIRETANQLWISNSIQYQKYWETIKQYIPPDVIGTFHENNGFHDCLIKSVSINRTDSGNYTCCLEVGDTNQIYCIQMFELKAISINVPTFRNCIMGQLSWGYHEFEQIAPNVLRLSILCDIENEMSFDFRRISIAPM